MTITDSLSGRAVENSIGIAALAETVFDDVADVRREPEWNPQLREAEKLTPGTIGGATRYRVRTDRSAGTAVIENTAFDRTRNWSPVSTSRRLEVHFRGPGHRIPGQVPASRADRIVPARGAAGAVAVPAAADAAQLGEGPGRNQGEHRTLTRQARKRP